MITYFLITGIISSCICIAAYNEYKNFGAIIWWFITGWIFLPLGIILIILILTGKVDPEKFIDEIIKLGTEAIEFKNKIINMLKSIFKK